MNTSLKVKESRMVASAASTAAADEPIVEKRT